MKDLTSEIYLKCLRLLSKFRFNSHNLLNTVTTCVLSFVRYIEVFVRWTKKRLQPLERRRESTAY